MITDFCFNEHMELLIQTHNIEEGYTLVNTMLVVLMIPLRNEFIIFSFDGDIPRKKEKTASLRIAISSLVK